ncbi:GNAT family N-acyltransferase [Yoonia sp.]|uniref:GNAT family N-acetyltransferase n=1 Tax=Yoonia sp. TaxID=2212373 RepID=UPI0025D53ABF|nr:GNAT family N-acyltransferase [Yoonia sp.]
MSPRPHKLKHIAPILETRLAVSAADLHAAQRLRYDVFVKELGAGGSGVSHDMQLERDYFDAFAQHLLLIDRARPDDAQVVGVYRVMTEAMAARAGRFYCEDEYDLSSLRGSGQKLLELGRSCLHPDYRGGAGMLHLWAALSDYVTSHEIDVLFGVASFHGTDIASLAQPLSWLYHKHLAPAELRVTAKGQTAERMDVLSPDKIDRIAAVRQIPALIKGYLRLGGTVGDGAFVDHDFNTTDICLILQKDVINALQQKIYTTGGARG